MSAPRHEGRASTRSEADDLLPRQPRIARILGREAERDAFVSAQSMEVVVAPEMLMPSAEQGDAAAVPRVGLEAELEPFVRRDESELLIEAVRVCSLLVARELH